MTLCELVGGPLDGHTFMAKEESKYISFPYMRKIPHKSTEESVDTDIKKTTLVYKYRDTKMNKRFYTYVGTTE
jgi:hypothetical protein